MIKVPKAIGFPLLAAWGYGVLYYTANSAIYYPFRYPRGDWALRDALGAQDVWLRTADGVKLHGWWLPVERARFATLFLHGNGGNVTHVYQHALAIREAGSSVLLIDYRGYGKSEGRPGEKGLYADATAGYDYLRGAGFPSERIVIQGLSLGTAVSVDLASRRPCAGVVLEAPFPSAARVAAGVLPVIGPLVVRSYDSASKIGRVRAPLFFIHGNADRVIRIGLGRELYAAAPQPKSFWEVNGADHNDLVIVAGAAYSERLRDFYKTLGTP